MSKKRVLKRRTVLAMGLVLVGMTTAIQAATINYGDFSGATVVYQQVTEASVDPLFPLFGAPDLVIDTLDFKPLQFESQSAGSSPGADVTDGTLMTTIMAKPGTPGIDLVRILEAGDFTLSGNPDTMGMARATLHVRLEVVEIDGAPLPVPIPFLLDDDVLFSLPGDVSGFWDLSAEFDVNMLLAEEGSTSGRATKIDIALNNTLTTTSQDGSVSFIKKKDFFITTVTIPEPASAVLILLGVLCCGLARRRR